MKKLDNLSIDVVMSLYRERVAAERREDEAALMKLEERYPDLFSEEFENFIHTLQACIQDIKQTHGHDFQQMLEPEQITSH